MIPPFWRCVVPLVLVVGCAWPRFSIAQPVVPAVIVRFDSTLKGSIAADRRVPPDVYRRAIVVTLQSWYPERDIDKREVLQYLISLKSRAGELGMAAAALIPFHDPATVEPILARARNDSVPALIASYMVGAAAAILSMRDLSPQYANLHDSGARSIMRMLGQFANQAARSSTGHVYALRLRQQFDMFRTVRANNIDRCEANSIGAEALIGTLDLRDADVLEPILASRDDCALGPLIRALSYVADRDFPSDAGAAQSASTWWHAYLRDHPDGEWRPAARSALVSRGYAVTGNDSRRATRELLRALNDSTLPVRYKALRMLNDQFHVSADLGPILDADSHPGTLYDPVIDRASREAQLRDYWTQRLRPR